MKDNKEFIKGVYGRRKSRGRGFRCTGFHGDPAGNMRIIAHSHSVLSSSIRVTVLYS